MGLFTDRQENLSQLKTWTNTNLSGLWPLSSKSLAKSSSQNGPIWSRRLCSRNWLPLMRTGSTFAWLHWSDTFTSDPPSESRRSSAFTEDTRTMVLPPSHFCASSGSVARKVMQALEAIKLVEKDANGGRRLTSQGFRDLDRIASQIKQAKA